MKSEVLPNFTAFWIRETKLLFLQLLCLICILILFFQLRPFLRRINRKKILIKNLKIFQLVVLEFFFIVVKQMSCYLKPVNNGNISVGWEKPGVLKLYPCSGSTSGHSGVAVNKTKKWRAFDVQQFTQWQETRNYETDVASSAESCMVSC